MFLGLQWYWWLLIAVGVIIVIPIKIKFLTWWNEFQREQKKNQRGKWGDEE